MNLRLLFGLLLAVVLLAGLTHLLHSYQIDRNSLSLRNKAYEAHENDQPDDAIRHLTRYLSFRPHDVEALAMLGQWSDETARSPQTRLQAFFWIDQALRADQQHDDLRRRAIRLAVKLGRYQDALAHLKRFCSSADDYCGNDAALSSLKAQSHYGMGQFDDAAEWFLHAIKLDESQPANYVDLIVLIEQRGTEMNLRPLAEKFIPQSAQAFNDPDEKPDIKPLIEAILTAMVQGSQGSVRSRAFLARAVYRHGHGQLEKAADDVAEAIALSEESAAALMQGAEIELARAADAQLKGLPVQAESHRNAALEYANRGRRLAPDDLKFLLLLSRLEEDAGHVDVAERYLRQGLEFIDEVAAKEKPKADKESARQRNQMTIQLTWALANIQISQSFIDPATPNLELLAQVQDNIQSLKELSARPALGRFLEARILLGKRAWHDAAHELELLRLELADFPQVTHITDLALADCYDRIGNPDYRLRIFRRTVREDPFWAPGRLGLAQTLVSVDKLDEAIEIYHGFVEFPGASFALARLLILKQLQLPAEQRRWENVERILAIADRQATKGSSDNTILRAEVLFQRQQFDEAERLLMTARDAHPDDVSLWSALAMVILRRDDQDESRKNERTLALLEEATQRLGVRVELQAVRIRQAQQLEAARAPALLAEVENHTRSLSSSDRERLFRELAQAYFQLELFDKSVACWQLAVEEAPHALDVYVGLAHAASRLKTSDILKTALAEIRKIEGVNGPNGDYIEANALLLKLSRQKGLFSKAQLDQLKFAHQLLTRAAQERPSWLVVPRSLGLLETMRGNADAAFTYFRKAMTLGDRSRDTVFRVISYLYEHRRNDEAHEEINRVASRSPELLTGDLARLASNVAWRREQFDDAIRIVKDSNDYRDLILQAQIKIARGELGPDVDELFTKACEQAPEVPQVWYLRVTFLVRAGNLDKAAAVIRQVSERVPADPKQLRPLTLAMCYEGAGQTADAEESYLKALETDSQNIGLRRVLISFYLRNNELDKAAARVDQLLDPAAGLDKEIVDDARRTKAIIMASRGSYEELAKALRMLRANSDKVVDTSAADLRVQAAILGRSTLRRDQIRLIAVLEEIARRQEPSSSEKLQLARLYEATGRWPEALAAYRKLKKDDPGNPIFLFEFIVGALNQKHPDADTISEAAEATDNLQQLEPDSFRTAITRARLLSIQDHTADAVIVLQSYLKRLSDLKPEELLRDLVKQQKPLEAIAALKAVVQKTGDSTARTILERVEKFQKSGDHAEALAVLQRYLIASDYVAAVQGEIIRATASVLETIGEFTAADEAYQMYVARSTQPDTVLVRVAFLARRNKIDEALDLCDSAASTSRPGAVASVSVGVIRVGSATPQQVARVEDRLLSALEMASPPLVAELSVSLADLRDYQGRYSEAAAIYRRLLDSNERNIVALNNLAWLISFQPMEKETALSLINRAIQLVGPVPDLLDTRAVIFLNLDRPREAIQDLDNALKEIANSSIWYHLAQARMKLGDKSSAVDSYRKADEAGFNPRLLHTLEQPAYQQLLKQLPQDSRRAQR